ncbi:MAG: hypothetical protein EA382_13630 [Spirochaetaceae bacterium]|nr:MAG: hypothetical protein EA382_13630 [Spirochaetaceae bacterium]
MKRRRTTHPIVAEAISLYVESRPFRSLHGLYVAALAIVVVVAWPGRSPIYFYRGGFVPPVFLTVIIAQTVLIGAFSTLFGLGRPASRRTTGFVEWIEGSPLPTREILGFKHAIGLIHTLVLVTIATPIAVVAAVPVGVPPVTIASSIAVVALTGIVCRSAGLLIGSVGELSYVVLVVGPWVFAAALFIGTIVVYPPLNPIAAVSTVVNAESASVIARQIRTTFVSAVPLSALIIAVHGRVLARIRRLHRERTGRHAEDR